MKLSKKSASLSNHTSIYKFYDVALQFNWFFFHCKANPKLFEKNYHAKNWKSRIIQFILHTFRPCRFTVSIFQCFHYVLNMNKLSLSIWRKGVAVFLVLWATERMQKFHKTKTDAERAFKWMKFWFTWWIVGYSLLIRKVLCLVILLESLVAIYIFLLITLIYYQQKVQLESYGYSEMYHYRGIFQEYWKLHKIILSCVEKKCMDAN